jgi:exopolysaccharide production protein ExoZ
MATLPVVSKAARPIAAVSGATMPKLYNLQILRTMAASLVVVDHAYLTLIHRGLPLQQYTEPAILAGNLGVAAFFVISGLIMMRQSADRFGAPGSWLLFAQHRLVRIVPMYWIATLVWFVAKQVWHNPTGHAKAQILLSLFFIPDVYAENGVLQPILELGWTLNYEMSFYLLFTLCLLFRRRIGVALLVGVPFALIVVRWTLSNLGAAQVSPAGHPLVAIRGFYTNSIIHLFALGVLLGFAEIKFTAFWRRIRLPISPALLMLAPTILIFAMPTVYGNMRSGPLSWFAVLVVVLCSLVALDRPGWFNRSLVLLGDASYSTYLFHLWALIWVLNPVLQRHASWTATPAHAAILAVICVICANILGLLIHLAVERPITRSLRKIRLPLGDTPSQASLPYTAAATVIGSGTTAPAASTS